MVIEKGVTIPPPFNRRKSKTPHGRVLDEMQPDDSVLFYAHREAQNFRMLGYNRGFKMSIRKMADGWRVWRVA